MSNFWGAFNQRKKAESEAEHWYRETQRLSNENFKLLEETVQMKIEIAELKRKVEAWERLTNHEIKKKY